MHITKSLGALVATSALLLSSCGTTPESTTPVKNVVEPPPSQSAPTTTAPSPEPSVEESAEGEAESPAGTVTSYRDAQPAVLQIKAQGSFRSFGEQTTVGAWAGSGFFIDESGLAVTNNHVVQGAATLEVFAGGDSTRSWNARLIGGSECNDIAVLQVDLLGGTTTHLEWYTEDPTPGLEIYVAGFPLADPEYTLVKGIIAKAKARGDTAFSSVPHTVQYDAQSQPGNSGGPVIDSTGKVVAVHYQAGGPRGGTSQFFGISADVAQRVSGKLQEGTFESLGIGADAFIMESGLSGVWVSGVTPGGIAAKAGVVAGDVILSLNGFPVGKDGTMKDYCNILRTAGPDQPITVQVLRPDTGDILVGEVNGAEEIAPVQPISSNDARSASSEGGDEYTYRYMADSSGRLRISVPDQWTDRNDAPLEFPSVMVAPDIAAFDSYQGSGVLVALVEGGGGQNPQIREALGEEVTCGNRTAPFEVDTGLVNGSVMTFEGCPAGSVIVGGFTAADDASMGVLLIGVASNQSDLHAINQALNSLVYTGKG